MACLATGARAGEPPLPQEQLRPGVPADVYVAPGRATTVLIHAAQKVAAISLASPVVTYRYDKSLNQIEITPTVRSGGVETNLNLRIGQSVYVLLVKVVNDVRAQFLRDFVVEGEAGPDDEAGLDQARPLAPSEIDIVGAAKTLERAQRDPVFRQSRPELRIESLNRTLVWNDCAIVLKDMAQFIDLDLLVFRAQWVNRTADALYLDAAQYGLFAGAVKIPIIARYKVRADPIVYPGQEETVFLAVQGSRLSRHNDWRLELPRDAAALGRPPPKGLPP